MTKKSKKPQPKRTTKVGRDAATGLFVTIKEANRRKKTTVIETIKYY